MPALLEKPAARPASRRRPPRVFSNPANPLRTAAGLGDLDRVLALLPSSNPATRLPAWRAACRYGHPDVVEVLFRHIPPSERSHSLKLAAADGHVETVGLLLPDAGEEDRRLAMRAAASKGHIGVVEVLLPGSSPSLRADALFWAAEAERLDAVAVLQPLCTPADQQSRLGSALVGAALRGRLRTVRAILSRVQPSPEKMAHALSEAAHHGHAGTVWALLPLCDPRSRGKALVQAASQKHAALARALVCTVGRKALESLNAAELLQVPEAQEHLLRETLSASRSEPTRIRL